MLTPAGGAQKVSFMVALLTSEELNVIVLLDKETEAEATRIELIKSKLIAENNVVLLSAAFGSAAPQEADTEDLIHPAVDQKLVLESYAKELMAKTLTQ